MSSKYLRLNGKYLKEAEELLLKHDYPQASEKLWGAFAEVIKAVASKRRVKPGTHKSIAQYVSNLHNEHPELRLIDAFKHAESLHINFYEDHLPDDHVMISANVIKQTIDKLKNLL